MLSNHLTWDFLATSSPKHILQFFSGLESVVVRPTEIILRPNARLRVLRPLSFLYGIIPVDFFYPWRSTNWIRNLAVSSVHIAYVSAMQRRVKYQRAKNKSRRNQQILRFIVLWHLEKLLDASLFPVFLSSSFCIFRAMLSCLEFLCFYFHERKNNLEIYFVWFVCLTLAILYLF